MGVTRQTISRWESDEVVPELAKLMEISDIFTCKLDALVKDNLSDQGKIYSKVQIKRVASFRMARYIMISRNPEGDVHEYMKKMELHIWMCIFMLMSITKADVFQVNINNVSLM